MKREVSTIFLSFLIFFIFTSTASAQVFINEVQIAPIAERFIELYNTGSSDVDLTGWYIQRKTTTGNKFSSLVTSPKFENKSIKAGGYFLISRSALSNADIVINNMTLTDSNTLRLRNSEKKDVDLVVLGNLNEGESYQKKQNDDWVSATPTPATVNLNIGLLNEQTSLNNSIATNTSDNTGANNTNNSNSTSVNTGNSASASAQAPSSQQAVLTAGGSPWPEEPQIFARIKKAPRSAVVGADVLFEGEALGLVKKPLENARYLWTFGDGGSKEGKKVFYRYSYLGEYVVVLNVSSGKYSASDRIVIKVIPLNIEISSVGTGDDSFVEIYNKTKYELNLSLWKLRAGNRLFIIPNDMIIMANAKIIFPPQHTGFKILKQQNINLLYPNGNTVTSFIWTPSVQANSPAIIQVDQQLQLKPNFVKDRPLQTFQRKESRQIKVKKAQKKKQKEKIPANITENNTKDIVLAQSANIFTATNNNDNSIYKWFLAVAALASVSIFGMFASEKIHKKEFNINKEADLSRQSFAEAEEYEIIDDEE